VTNYLIFIIGFAVLIKGADLLVKGAASVARRLNVSDLAIGLTVVSVGSSAPEMVVNIVASLRGSSEIALGNILGSNIANILLGLGIASIIYPIRVKKSTTYKEIPFSLLAVVVIAIMANDALLEGTPVSSITRSDGLVLLSFFSIFLYYIYTIGIGRVEDEKDLKKYTLSMSLLLIFVGISGLGIGGKWVVDGARAFVRDLGISEAFVGLTFVAFGTSLPEIVTSAVAAYRRNTDIAVGNIVGSNIFNIFWVLGLTSIVRPIQFRPELNVDIIMVVIVTAFLFATLFVGKKQLIDRQKGIGFITLYLLYIGYLIYRG
jgi:cation:H+ antiporter